MCISLILNSIQLDELWSYVKNKKTALGFTSIYAESRFCLDFEMLSRTKHTVNKLLKGIFNMILIPSGKIKKITKKTIKLETFIKFFQFCNVLIVISALFCRDYQKIP